MAGGARLQDAAVTGNGGVVNCLGLAGQYKLTVIGAGTITGGDVTWEHNPVSADYAGAWEAVAPSVAPVDATVVSVEFEGVLHYTRARITNDIAGGGTVTVRLQTPLV